jgi:hypothetical protein
MGPVFANREFQLVHSMTQAAWKKDWMRGFMTEKSNRKMGWWAIPTSSLGELVNFSLLCLTLIAVTTLTFTSAAWALDFESSIARQETSSQEILSGLGSGRSSESSRVSQETRRTVHVQLIRKSKTKSFVKTNMRHRQMASRL